MKKVMSEVWTLFVALAKFGAVLLAAAIGLAIGGPIGSSIAAIATIIVFVALSRASRGDQAHQTPSRH